MVATPVKTNFLYRFETGSGQTYRYSNVAEDQILDAESFSFIQIEHTAPTYSNEPQEAEVKVTIKDSNAVANLYLLSPPPYSVKLMIYEYDRGAETATAVYRGWVVRSKFDLFSSTVIFRLKSVWLYFERESFTDSLSALSRFNIYDPRSGVDIASLRTGITVVDLDEFRDVIQVTGISQPDDYFRGGLIVAPDQDARSILEHKTVSGDKFLTLSGAFPQVTLDVGFTADIYPGDDLLYETWANKFGAVTNNGEKHGGWPFMPNRDPAIGGVA
jgi:hypothetical protein